MNIVAHADGEGPGKCFAFGFLKGKLVYCDGKSYRPLSLKQSAKVFFDVIATRGWTGNTKNQERWFKMVSKALPA